jgi:ABC-type Zn uptake system ZnuABC Zn-binding protein ZnuA
MRTKGRLWVGWVAVFGFGLLGGFLGCGAPPNPWKDVPGGPTKVVASFPPLYCFTRNVAGPDAAVLCLLVTTGPHEFRPEKLDALKLSRADLFLVNGLGLDNWVPSLVGEAHNNQLQVVKVGEAAIPKGRLLPGGKDDEDEPGEEHGHGHEHHGAYDPHVWLGIPEAIAMVGGIREVLKKQDPAHAAGFDKRAAEYVARLKELHEYGKKAFAGKKNKKFVATHDSLRYFARSFGLDVVDSIQRQPGVQADVATLAKLTELCRKENVRVITVEPQYSRATAETLGRQLKAHGLDVRIVEVDPIETADPPLAPDYYLRKMRDNIDALARNLE